MENMKAVAKLDAVLAAERSCVPAACPHQHLV
jgi:hypothetical protein